VEVAYKIATAVVFHSVWWHKTQTFFKRVERLQRLHYQLHTSNSHSRIKHDPRLSLHADMVCRPTLGVGVLEQSRYSASIERVLMYIRSVQISKAQSQW